MVQAAEEIANAARLPCWCKTNRRPPGVITANSPFESLGGGINNNLSQDRQKPQRDNDSLYPLARHSSNAPSPLWWRSAVLRVQLRLDHDLVLLFDSRIGRHRRDHALLLEERTWRHGRGHLLVLDECTGRHERDRALLLEDGVGRHGGGRALPSLLARQRCRYSLLRRRPPLRRSRDAQRRLLGGGEAAQVHCIATAPHPRLVGLGLAGRVQAHAEVACLVVGHEQHQFLRLRLLSRLLARQRHRRRCCPLRRRCLPLRRSRQAQRRLLGGGEVTQVHHVATAPHLRQVGLGLVALVKVHAEVARLVLGHVQRQPLRLRLLPRLLARQRCRRCNPLRRCRLPLWRSRDAQRRLLGGVEDA
eukprot:scaffold28834_cov53-Phaeocystis_antarctica.AAC.2